MSMWSSMAIGEAEKVNSSRKWLIGALVAVLIAGALGVWLMSRDEDESGSSATVATEQYSYPTIVSESELQEFGSVRGPAYWVGPVDATELELTQVSSGSVFVRYLTGDAEAGDDRDEFVSVATYAQAGGYDDLVRASERKGSNAEESQSGALIVTTQDAPNSAYFSFPGADFQVEVYSPEAGEAKELVDSGTVELLQ